MFPDAVLRLCGVFFKKNAFTSFNTVFLLFDLILLATAGVPIAQNPCLTYKNYNEVSSDVVSGGPLRKGLPWQHPLCFLPCARDTSVNANGVQ